MHLDMKLDTDSVNKCEKQVLRIRTQCLLKFLII